MKMRFFLPLLIALSAITFLGCPAPVTGGAPNTPVEDPVDPPIEEPVDPPVVVPTDKVIDKYFITISKPIMGGTPATTIKETTQYTGTVRWEGSPETFAPCTIYTAIITLKEKTGYTLTGLPSDCFYADETISTQNSENSGVITVVFRPTQGAILSDVTSTNIGLLKAVRGGPLSIDKSSGINSFRISTCEITRAQFLAIMGTDPVDSTTYSSGLSDPVQCVNWYHAIAFCNKLSLKENLTPVYSVSCVTDWANLEFDDIPGSKSAQCAIWDAATVDLSANGYRLPTEMEWLYAATGNSEAIYPMATSYDDEAWYMDNSDGKTHPVGTKAPNSLGLYDMAGNVAEWCFDWARIGYGAGIDYQGPSSGTKRVVYGGKWDIAYLFCCNPYYIEESPWSTLMYGTGFRVVRR